MQINDITHISKKYGKNLKKITQPLLDQFGITLFGMNEISNDGHWSAASSNFNFFDYCIGNKFYKCDPILIDPIYYKTGVNYISSHDYEEQGNNILKEAKKLFDMDHCLIITEKNSFGCQFYYFATATENNKIINTYMSKLHLLRKFINYFKQENKIIIHETKDYMIDLKQLRPNDYFKNSNMYDVFLETEKVVTDNHNSALSKLTHREHQCMLHFLNGKTAKETAKILQLSHRTVEDYLSNMKTKLFCQNKRELLALFPTKLI